VAAAGGVVVITVCFLLFVVVLIAAGSAVAPRVHLWIVRATPDPAGCAGFDDALFLPGDWVALGVADCPHHGRTAHRMTEVGVDCCACAEATVGEAP
jgi:hypothetical protein